MSIFDIDEERLENTIITEQAKEEDLFRCLAKGKVACAAVSEMCDSLQEKICRIYGGPAHDNSFAGKIQNAIANAVFSLLKKYSNRGIVYLDCRKLKKSDALGFMRALSSHGSDLIVVIENVTQIPDGDPGIYDDKQYVIDLLVKSWKNVDVHIDDFHFDRRPLTIVLTCPVEDKELLQEICRECSYDWADLEELVG